MHHITSNEEKVLRAGARAAMKAGTCLHTHTTAGTMGIEQCEIVLEEGLDMSKFIVAHVDAELSLEGDEATGANIVRRAMEEPVRQIAHNAGLEGSIIVERLKGEKVGIGYNAATGEWVDMVEAGIVDPQMKKRKRSK